jgi:hypothetical protein
MISRDSLPETAIKRMRRLLVDCVGPRSSATGTELALMHFRGELTRGQLEASQQAVEARSAWLRCIDAKNIRTASLEAGSGRRIDPDLDSPFGQQLVARELAARARHESVMRVIDSCGGAAKRDFWDVAYENVTPSWMMKNNVQRVAEALRFFREQRRRIKERART